MLTSQLSGVKFTLSIGASSMMFTSQVPAVMLGSSCLCCDVHSTAICFDVHSIVNVCSTAMFCDVHSTALITGASCHAMVQLSVL